MGPHRHHRTSYPRSRSGPCSKNRRHPERLRSPFHHIARTNRHIFEQKGAWGKDAGQILRNNIAKIIVLSTGRAYNNAPLRTLCPGICFETHLPLAADVVRLDPGESVRTEGPDSILWYWNTNERIHAQ